MELKIEYLELDKLRPYENNARKHADEDVDAIVASIQQFGFDDPIGIWSEDNLIVEGHGRLLAAKKLGIKTVPCIRLDHLSDEERRAYALAHNRTAELSGWDFDVQEEELSRIGGIDMSVFGFDSAQLADSEVEEDDFQIELKTDPKVKRGEIYQLGNHRLMCGDSLLAEDVDKLMDGKEADLLLTDPPYNVALGMGGSFDEARKRHRRTDGLVIANDKMEDDQFRDFLTVAFTNGKDHLRAGGAFYIWYASTNGIFVRSACDCAGLKVRQVLVWAKNRFTLGRQDYQWKHELCLYGWKEGVAHYFCRKRNISTIFKSAFDLETATREELIEYISYMTEHSTILEEDRPEVSSEHPTMKPIELMERQIKNSTRSGQTVLDLFGGSGSTLIACERSGRSCYMMELDPHYAEVIIERYEEETGSKAVLLN